MKRNYLAGAVLLLFATAASSADQGANAAALPGTAKARNACLDEVAKITGRARNTLSVIEVLPSEAGIGVNIQVPGAQAPWSCLADANGKVQGASYTGSEGKL